MIINYMYPFTETFLDYPDDESLALSIYFLGCDNGCIDCSNPQFIDSNYEKGEHTELDIFIDRVKLSSKKSNTNKLVFLGVDSLSIENISKTQEILNNLYNEFDICIYTGHNIDHVLKYSITKFNYLKCGRYINELKQESIKTDIYLKFASSNQKLYDHQFNLLSENAIYYFKRG